MAARSGLLKRDPELRRLFQDNETLINNAASCLEIEAATAKMEPYDEEFRKLLEDQPAFLDRCQELFSEETFAPLRFTAADVERGFKQVGFPSTLALDEEMRKLCVAAVCFLASKELRSHLAMELMLRLPGYVDQGRYLDAHLVGFAAEATVEDATEVNPFLLRMFLYGLDAWEMQRHEEQKALLRELGMDLRDGARPEEIDAWVAEHSADPAKAARLEQLLASKPGLFSQAAPTLDMLARQAVSILNREDARCLWLTEEEIGPWVPFLMEKVEEMLAKYPPEEEGAPVPEARQEAAFDEIYLPAMREVAKSIFTPERINKLVADLRAYRNRLFAAGEKQASYCAMSAINYVEPEDDASQNVFLVNLCAKSVHRAPERKRQSRD
jgi:hypothetical protein